MNNFLKKDFENLKKGYEVEIVLNKNNTNNEVISICGKIIDNGDKLKELHLKEVSDDDTIIRYDQIKSVEIFNL